MKYVREARKIETHFMQNLILTPSESVLLVLTQYKRHHLEEQLQAIASQTKSPEYIVVFQNENHVDISDLKDKYNFIHIKSDYNTKFFGRFAACFTFPVDICIVMDDDVIPGKNFIKNYVSECINLNAIVGGNGRVGFLNKNNVTQDIRINYLRPKSVIMDFVGHVWCFKKDWLYAMFSIKPFTYDTGEDMHLCFSAKVLFGIPSYSCKEAELDDCNDIRNDLYAVDSFSSFLNTTEELRKSVEQYFIDNYNLDFIKTQ